ncbi:hypothetical protein MAR621_03295 [Maribacter dokdonensis]|mgnify:CR=1 FL=1|uniref:hypothetical protein n=1 Tax=Maribacter dokdonensis TaxID=320912 RepID=UPI001B1B3F1A|nr:hypothetical protein [Maribacter dokdonensis]CAG2533018.1 hypothetical protein MAR621_03295 [Maribacter dokdonensis]|tara:strand:+ start:2556 stop:3023 length:468 start_codon:yes stop_codon:yes gene_type:complete
MTRKRRFLLIIIVVAIVFLLRKRIAWAFYDLQEYYNVSNSLVWDENRELKWSDFKYDATKKFADNIYARVGISQRYHIADKIEFRSNTLFLPDKSFVTDTTDKTSLRIAQARFDLCEVYRIKLEQKVMKLRKKASMVTLDTLEKYIELYYDNFEK